MNCAIAGPYLGQAAVCIPTLRSLPEWFGIEEAIVGYAAEIDGLPTFLAGPPGDVSGFLSLKQHTPHAAEVNVMGARREYHRTGVGRRLIQAAAAWLRQQGVEYLQVKTLGPSSADENYARTRAFYQALGFRPLEELKQIWDAQKLLDPNQTAGKPGRPDSQMSVVYIETARLILRTVTLDDVAEVALSWNLDGPPLSQEEASGRVQWMLANHERNAPGRLVHLCLAIVQRETGRIIGWCGLDHRDASRAYPVLFYLLQAAHWGQGLATEAARAVLDTAFGEFALPRVDAAAAADNAASARILEKIGMRRLGRDEEGGHAFSLTRDEFLRIRRRDCHTSARSDPSRTP